MPQYNHTVVFRGWRNCCQNWEKNNVPHSKYDLSASFPFVFQEGKLYCYTNDVRTLLRQQEKRFVFTHNQFLHPDHISPLYVSLSIDTQLYSIKRPTMRSTQYIIQEFKSPRRRLSVSLCEWAGEENGVVTCSEHVQADLNGWWYSDFPEELLSGLCRCFRFQREAIIAQPVDLIHMYGCLSRSVRLPPPCLPIPDGLTACRSPNWFLAPPADQKDEQRWFHKLIIPVMRLDVWQQQMGSICRLTDTNWVAVLLTLGRVSLGYQYETNYHAVLSNSPVTSPDTVRQTSNNPTLWGEYCLLVAAHLVSLSLSLYFSLSLIPSLSSNTTESDLSLVMGLAWYLFNGHIHLCTSMLASCTESV